MTFVQKSGNVVAELSFSSAVRIVKLCRILNAKDKEYVLSRQLLKCGTLVGANVREAQNAESRNDFTHKLGIAQKEAGEALYWIELLLASDYLGKKEFESIYGDAKDLHNIIKRIIITTKNNP